MALLNILEYPDPRLRTRASPVPAVTPAIRQLAADMLETMYAAPGVGLAATQVDVHIRLLVMDVSDGRDQPMVLINPELLAKDGSELGEEGCLSVPDFTEKVERAARIRVRYLDLEGETRELEAEGLMAVCIQHEMDHLEGVLFIDHLSRLKRESAVRKVKKAARERDAPPARI